MILYTEYDEYELMQTAKAVEKFNKYQKGTDPKQIVEQIKSTAATNTPDSCYVRTRGYVITYFKDSERRDRIKTSVDSSLFD